MKLKTDIMSKRLTGARHAVSYYCAKVNAFSPTKNERMKATETIVRLAVNVDELTPSLRRKVSESVIKIIEGKSVEKKVALVNYMLREKPALEFRKEMSRLIESGNEDVLRAIMEGCSKKITSFSNGDQKDVLAATGMLISLLESTELFGIHNLEAEIGLKIKRIDRDVLTVALQYYLNVKNDTLKGELCQEGFAGICRANATVATFDFLLKIIEERSLVDVVEQLIAIRDNPELNRNVRDIVKRTLSKITTTNDWGIPAPLALG
ncbi:MAG: hypothetical protein Q7S22_06760 [Candidatus Micrarchaeota archaeon]|nr:hypothetical protein [Candidatus Micrarchaeota archaeon]